MQTIRVQQLKEEIGHAQKVPQVRQERPIGKHRPTDSLLDNHRLVARCIERRILWRVVLRSGAMLEGRIGLLGIPLECHGGRCMQPQDPLPKISWNKDWHVRRVQLVEQKYRCVIGQADRCHMRRKLVVGHAGHLDLPDMILPVRRILVRRCPCSRQVVLEQDLFELYKLQGEPMPVLRNELVEHALGQSATRPESADQHRVVSQRHVHSAGVEAQDSHNGRSDTELPMHFPGHEHAL
mmetsp:Transcript_41055/g.129971  ORF Transcript_41055/g.129971 Transcript_41055/m.129971 type:complete len:238 (+) Transcript_41055:442-1155(+)